MRKALNAAHWYTIGSLRKMYAWVLGWAHTRYASLVLFLVAFAESVFFPIPPDAVLLALGIGKPRKAIWWAAVCTAGSVLGGILGYYIGWGLFDVVGERIIGALSLQAEFDRVGEIFVNNAILTIVGAAFTPIPYKVFTIAAGFWQINVFLFILASIIGRGARFFVTGVLLYFFGKRVARFIDRYLAWVSVALFALVIVLVVLFRFFNQI